MRDLRPASEFADNWLGLVREMTSAPGVAANADLPYSAREDVIRSIEAIQGPGVDPQRVSEMTSAALDLKDVMPQIFGDSAGEQIRVAANVGFIPEAPGQRM